MIAYATNNNNRQFAYNFIEDIDPLKKLKIRPQQLNSCFVLCMYVWIAKNLNNVDNNIECLID